jgi:hypothetical protein
MPRHSLFVRREFLAADLVLERAMSKSKKTCPNCSEFELTRVARHGFMQERVYPKFGMFPWECGQCRQIFLLKSRGRSYRKAGPASGNEK